MSCSRLTLTFDFGAATAADVIAAVSSLSGTQLAELTIEHVFDRLCHMFTELVEELIVTDDDALIERLRSNELLARRVAAEQAAIAREIERRNLFLDDGHRSTKSLLRAELAWSNAQAGTGVRLATLCDTVPDAGEALMTGRIGTAQAAELARCRANPRVGDQLGEVAPVLLDAAEQMKFEDFRIVTKRWETLADADGAEQAAAANIENRSASVIEASGELFMRATGGSALEVAELVAIFDAFVEHEFRLDCEQRDKHYGPNAPTALLPRTDAQRRRDALQHIFRAAQLATQAGLEARPIPVMLNIGVSQFDAEHALANNGLTAPPSDLTCPSLVERRKETLSGSPVTDADIVRTALHERVRAVLMDPTGLPVSYGRSRRLFTGPMRDMARLLGHRCSHPGCDIRAENCEIDHVHEYANGGDTSLVNAGLECSSHNRHKHRAKLTRTRCGTDQTITIRADGTHMQPVGQRPIDPIGQGLVR